MSILVEIAHVSYRADAILKTSDLLFQDVALSRIKLGGFSSGDFFFVPFQSLFLLILLWCLDIGRLVKMFCLDRVV